MSKRYLIIAVVGIVLCGAFFRFYQLAASPGGLFPDEAANGLDINLMEQGQLQPFYERGNGREALFFYLIWGAVKVFGRSPFAHHFVSSLVGIMAVLVCFLVTRKLFSLGEQDSPQESGPVKWQVPSVVIALLAATFMATSSWHVVLSRTAFRANMVPLCAGLAVWSLLSVILAKSRGKQYLWSLLFGATFALGFYTYIAYRIMLPLVFMLVVWPALAALKTWGPRLVIKKYLPLLLVSVISFVVVMVPLGLFFYEHPDWLAGRSSQVSIFSPDQNKGDLLGTALETTRLSLRAYFVDGDLNWRHNISGFPFLSPLVSPFFAFGLMLVLYGAIRYFLSPVKQQRRYPEYLLLGWFLSFILPVVTTAEGIPHGLRAIGTIPSVFIISAYGLYVVASRAWCWVRDYPQVHGHPLHEAWLQTGMEVLAVVYLLVLPVQTYAAYFVYAASSPEYFYSFRADLTVVSDYLNQHGSSNDTYLVLGKFSLQTVDYLTTKDGRTTCDRESYFLKVACVHDPRNRPYTQVDPEDSWRSVDAQKDGQLVWKRGLVPGMRVVFAQSSIFDIKKFKASFPEARLEHEARNRFGQAVLAVYRIN